MKKDDNMQKKIISTSQQMAKYLFVVKIHNTNCINKNTLNKLKHRGDTDIENYEKIQDSTNTKKTL